VVAMLAKIDPLPGPQCKSPVGHRQGQTDTQQTAFEVSRQVIRPFVDVLIVRLVFRHGAVEKGFEVAAYRWIGVFVQGQTGRGVLQQQVQQTHFYLTQLGQCLLDVIGDQVKASRAGPELYSGLVPHMYSKSGLSGSE